MPRARVNSDPSGRDLGVLLPNLERLASVDVGDVQLKQLSSVILPRVVELLEPDISCIYSSIAGGTRFEATAVYPAEFWRDPEHRTKFLFRRADSGAIRRALQTGDVHVVHDPRSAELRGEYVPFDTRVRLEILVPILATDPLTGAPGTIAVLVLSWIKIPAFADRAKPLLSLVRSIVGRHYELIGTRTARECQKQFVRAFAGLSQGATWDPYGSFLAALTSFLPIRLATFWRYNSLEPPSLTLRSLHPEVLDGVRLTPQVIREGTMALTASPVQSVFEDGRPHRFALTSVQSPIPNEDFLRQFGLEWWASFPILAEGGLPLGVINIWPEGPPDMFSDQVVEAFREYAGQMREIVYLVALSRRAALGDAFRLFVDNLVTFEDRQEAWDRLAGLVSGQLDAEACSIFLASSKHVLELKGSTGLEGNPPYSGVTYATNEGMTGYVFASGRPILYTRDLGVAEPIVHKSKYREVLRSGGRSRSILLMPIRGRGDEVIGVIRCNNKSTEGPFGVGEFSTDDVETLGTVAGIVSHLHLTSSRLAAKEREREERMRNLYHEILSPVDHLLAHLVWASHRVISEMKTADLARLKAKVLDMFQIGQHIANVTTLMNQDNATRRLQVSQVAVHDVVQRTLGFFASEARRRNVRVTPLLERISAFPCDEDALMRVCYNLFRNGLKYVDDSEPAKYMKVQLSSDEEGGMHITVEDNGIGVPAGEEERIFDRFYRGTNAAAHAPTGEGLGLWYCRSLVVRMGGKIWLRRRSKPTEFCVVLRR